MQDTVKRDLILVFKAASEAMDHPETCSLFLKDISNRTVHNSSIFQDEYSISAAILLYALSKVLERHESKQLYPKIKALLQDIITHLSQNNEKAVNTSIKSIFTLISKSDTKFPVYIQEVINQASIRKGSKVYAHGVSAMRTAQILGISPWEFYGYIGATSIPEVDTDIVSVRRRLQFTRGLFS
ncbi:hypothetical protein GOV09_04370 [Candidatus Woesearchaeota archaeon]|nr:hypothetical protein [Candidatus Woesearchaeota archaeon]